MISWDKNTGHVGFSKLTIFINKIMIQLNFSHRILQNWIHLLLTDPRATRGFLLCRMELSLIKVMSVGSFRSQFPSLSFGTEKPQDASCPGCHKALSNTVTIYSFPASYPWTKLLPLWLQLLTFNKAWAAVSVQVQARQFELYFMRSWSISWQDMWARSDTGTTAKRMPKRGWETVGSAKSSIPCSAIPHALVSAVLWELASSPCGAKFSSSLVNFFLRFPWTLHSKLLQG